MRTVRTHPLLVGGFFLVTIALAVAGIVWWLIPTEPLSAQEVMENACADSTDINEYDATLRMFGPEGARDGWVVMEINNAIGMRTRSYSPNNGGRSSESTLVSEGYTMWDDSGSGSSSRSEDDDDSYRVYSRRIEGNGQWGAWQVSQYPTDWGDGMTGSFCGYDVSIFDTFLYNGVETVGGTSTKKFTATVGSASLELATRLEFWIDADGKLIKKAQTLTNKDVRWELTYSGWGEANAIATPVTSGATPPGGDLPDTGPEPDATASPPATATPSTPAPESTATPVPTDTPEPTVTPVPATAWLEPDPETVTFDGSGWQTFTIHGTGVDRIDFSINAINHPDGPSSTGAVARTRRSTPPAASDACRNTGYEGYSENPGGTFSLVGCRAGTSIIQLGEFVYGSYVLLRRYTVDVTGGP
jgi:hypothetical protein